jgi:polyisoprenoid-binding protein YceI
MKWLSITSLIFKPCMLKRLRALSSDIHSTSTDVTENGDTRPPVSSYLTLTAVTIIVIVVVTPNGSGRVPISAQYSCSYAI